jgi:murein DD-endopeptidase MepM/ murein hydrolase activator NlpD
VGQRVREGQVIGYVGTTGFSTGCHLHLMVWINGRLRNPMTWF